jgi:hypothetical protein
MATILKNGVTYYVRDPYCLGRRCLDLGPDVKATFDEKGKDIRCRMSSECRTRLNRGCPRELPDYEAELVNKRMLSGMRIGRE